MIAGYKPEVRPIYSDKTCLLPSNSLCFISTQDLSIRALEEPNMATCGLCKTTLAVYSPESKIAILNLKPDHILKEGTQAGEAT